jgi:hypothetical protein
MSTLLCAEASCQAPRAGRRRLYCRDHLPAATTSPRRVPWRPARRDAAEQRLAQRAARRALEREIGGEDRIGTPRLLRAEAAEGQLRYEFAFPLAGLERVVVRKLVTTRPDAALRHRRVRVSRGGRVAIEGTEDVIAYHDGTGLPGAVARVLRHREPGRT